MDVAKQRLFRILGMIGAKGTGRSPLAEFLGPIERNAIFNRTVFLKGSQSSGCVFFVHFHTAEIIIILALFIFIAC